MAADVGTIVEEAMMESAEVSAEFSAEFPVDTSGELLAKNYFGTRKDSYEKFPSGGRDRSRRSRISTVPRMSLAITDLKRKSVCKWDNLMGDFADDFSDFEF